VKHQALIIAHSDGDGHLIAEQVRRNLSLIEGFNVQVVVDPEKTKDHKSWGKLDTIKEVENADLVFFLDLMFAPATFDQEAKYLVDFVQGRPEKDFYLIDHHPLPLRRLERANNLRVMYRPDVSECAIGPRSGMMIVAALCERQIAEVSDMKNPIHEMLAIGVRRAAAPGGPLAGEKLLALLKADRWESILQLGEDEPEYHRLPRGRRPNSQLPSDILVSLEREADALLAHQDTQGPPAPRIMRRSSMSYDAAVGEERFSYDTTGQRTLQAKTARARDLEAIITLLELAALSLTTAPGTTFTIEQLIEEARDTAGDDISLRDVNIVLKKGKTAFLQHVAGKEYRLK
jgi:hypothetical protein